MSSRLMGNLQKLEQAKKVEQSLKLEQSLKSEIESMKEKYEILDKKLSVIKTTLDNKKIKKNKKIFEESKNVFSEIFDNFLNVLSLQKEIKGLEGVEIDETNLNTKLGQAMYILSKSSEIFYVNIILNNENIDVNESNWSSFINSDGEFINQNDSKYNLYFEYFTRLQDTDIDYIFFLLKNEFSYRFPVDLSIDNENDIGIINDFMKYLEQKSNNLTGKQIDYISSVINENIKLYFYYILSNPNLSKDEKIEKIESYYRENIENNYFFPIRAKVSETLGTIIAKNTIGDELFEKLIVRNDGRVSKNIRLEFIKQAEIEKILEYVEENKLGLQSTLAFLDRLKKELNQKYDDALFQKYKEYKKNFLDLYKTKKNRNNRGELMTYYNQEHKNSNFAISETKDKLSDNLNIKKQEKETKTLIDKLKAKPAYREIKDELGKLENFDKSVLSILFKNYPSFVLRTFLLENKGKYKKDDVINALLDTKNLLKVLSILEFIKEKEVFNIDQTSLLKKLIEKGLIKDFDDIVNTVGTSIFKDYKLEVFKNKKINKPNATIFFKLMLLSKKHKLVFRNIPFSIEIVEQINEYGYGISTQTENNIRLFKEENEKYKYILSVKF